MTSELTPAQCPCASPSPQREHSPVLFTQHDQCPSAAVSDMTSFGVSDNELDDSLSLEALDAEGLSGSVTDPALLPPSASCNARLRADEGLHPHYYKGCQRGYYKGCLAAGWTSGLSLGAIRLSANACPPSFPKCTMSSQNHGVPPTRLASVLLLQLLSHPLTALKIMNTSTCLL